ncbi:MAG: iron chelate uptake ABC transporter family permease subunit [Planctomycetota bacterium]
MSDQLIRLLTLQDTNTRIALLGASLLGMAAGTIGVFIVLRRRALMGDALAHASLPGVWLAFAVVGERDFLGLMTGAAIAGALGVLCVTFIRAQTRIKEDAAIGIVLSVFFAIGLCASRIVQTYGGGNSAGLDGFILGKAASMLWEDVAAIGVVAVVVLLSILALYKELSLLCFDREFAASQGWPVVLLDLYLMLLLVLCTVIGLPAVGVVLMAALLIIPPAAARFWTTRLATMLVLSAAIGLFAAAMGTAASSLDAHLSTGPTIVLAAATCFIISMLFAPRRGMVADVLRRKRLSRRVGMQNLLRTVYEHLEQTHDAGRAWTRTIFRIDDLLATRSWSAGQARRQISRARHEGLLLVVGDEYQLTSTGLEAASRVVRTHRLWELFLVEQAAIAPDHVDRDADQIEHVLPASIITSLEGRLMELGRLTRSGDVPSSPHRLGESAV